MTAIPTPEPTFRLKDTLYSRQSFEDMVSVFTGIHPSFDRAAFFDRLYNAEWEEQTLMARMRHIAAVLRTVLPEDYRAALEIIKAAASSPIMKPYGFHVIALSEFCALYGLDDYDASLPALAHLTQFGSSEFAVRPFILHDTPRMMAQMLEWAGSDNEHVRRLASEGCRPRLPWGVAIKAFKQDPAPILPVLERLKHDPAEYVRRSVANNLNDIAKDNPDVVIDLLRRWQSDPNENTHWIVQRALRTLVKDGHTEALALLGFSDGAQVAIKSLSLDTHHIRVGDSITLSALIQSQADSPQRLVIDCVVHYMKANGKTAPKVFKLTTKELQPGETLSITKKLSFRPITTRVYHPGTHAVALQINGVEGEQLAFELLT